MLGGLISGVIGGVGASMVDLANQAQEEAKAAKKVAAEIGLLKFKSALDVAADVEKNKLKVAGEKEIEEVKQIGRKEIETIKAANDIAIEKLRGQNSVRTKATPTGLDESERFELDTRKTLKELLKDPEKNAAEIEQTERTLRGGKSATQSKVYSPVYVDEIDPDTGSKVKKVKGYNSMTNQIEEPTKPSAVKPNSSTATPTVLTPEEWRKKNGY